MIYLIGILIIASLFIVWIIPTTISEKGEIDYESEILNQDGKIELNTYDFTTEELLMLIPDNFYKYCRINKNFKTNLKNGQLWFSSPLNFNDPFDCKAYLNYGDTEEECRKNFEKFNKAFKIELPEDHMKVWNTLLKKPDDFNLLSSFSAANNFEEWLGVTCFSENYNNTLMWSHYTDSHKGVVLEFKKDINGFITKNLLPVNYYKSYPIINLSEINEDQMISVAFQVMCAKGNDWVYEKEWRAIKVPGNKLYSYNKSELTGIIFGLNTEEDVKKEIYDLINNSGYTNIEFREAEFKSREFTVDYKPYDRNK